MILLLYLFASGASHATTAFFYADKPPIAELAAHDSVVLDPRLVTDDDVAKLRATGTDVHAYVSIGEIEPSDPLYERVPPSAILTTNPGWKTAVVDLASPVWRRIILEERISPLTDRGFSGLFLDTLDSYHLTDDLPQQKAALARLLGDIQRDYPHLRLYLNRGFEILDQLPDKVSGVVAESLYKSHNPSTKKYTDVPAKDREWLLARFSGARQYADELIAIDYLPKLDAVAEDTAKRIAKHGITPWVTDPSLNHLGISTLIPVPRRILVLHNDTGKKLAARDVHTLFGATLDWYGYVAEFHNIKNGPPRMIKGVHAASMMWLTPLETSPHVWFDRWLERQPSEGYRVMMFGSLPTDSNKTLSRFGLRKYRFSKTPTAVELGGKTDLVGEFEAPLRVRRYDIPNVESIGEANKVHLKLKLDSGKEVHPVVTGSWGGVVHGPYITESIADGLRRYIIDPFKFAETALDHSPRPVFDTTTQNGKRLLTIHVDGDGFASRAFLPGSPLSGNVLFDQFLANTDLPQTISIIEGEVGKAGLFPEQHKELEAIARRIFALPNVELASHSYSHPFYWQTDVIGGSDKKLYGLHLPIPDYTLDLNREVQGSVDYINKRLAPKGKQVEVFLWSGSADPDAVALKLVEEAGLVNVNGGNTLALHSAGSTISNVWPQARRENGGMQVYAAIMNENVYTNDWTGPYYGFRKVIETFDITDAPRRLKPLCIYYHFYSATKPAAIRALREVYDDAIERDPFPIYLSEFAKLVQNYYTASLTKTLDGRWLVQNAGALRTLRVPQSAGYPKTKGAAVAGYIDINRDRYVHLADSRAEISFSDSPENTLQLASANGQLVDWRPNGDQQVNLRLLGHINIEFAVHTHTDCSLTLADGEKLRANSNSGKATFKLTTRDTGNALLVCK